MVEQEALADTGGKPSRMFAVDPAQHGLWDRMVEAGRISHQAWLRAVAESGFVGTCRRCGSYLRPRPADDRGSGVFDYEAECSNVHVSTVDVRNDVRTKVVVRERVVAGCGAVMVAPGGRLPGTAERESKAAAAAKRAAGKGKRA